MTGTGAAASLAHTRRVCRRASVLREIHKRCDGFGPRLARCPPFGVASGLAGHVDSTFLRQVWNRGQCPLPYKHGWNTNMAQVAEVRLVDDLDGGAAAESVAFGIDGRFYEIDLNEAHAARLREVFAPFISSARRASGSSPASPRAKAATRAGRSRGETAAIREWAIAHGHEVANRGRIPAQVLEACESRGSAPSAPPAPAAAPAVIEAQESEAIVDNKPKRRVRKKTAVAS